MESKDRKLISADEALTMLSNESIVSGFRRRGGFGLQGVVTMVDKDTGRVVFQARPNLIVLRGRTFALEKLFGSTIGASGVTGGAVPYVSDLNRTIIAFQVGNGGAPMTMPFSPYAPPPTGTAGVQLASPIPFRFEDTSQSGSGDPSQFIPPSEIGNYGGALPVAGGTPTQFYYWYKAFDVNPPAWYFSESLNTVYKSVSMTITADDCRTPVGNYLNELGLFFNRVSSADAQGGITYADQMEMFSRICFPTEYMSSGKELTIVYNIYA